MYNDEYRGYQPVSDGDAMHYGTKYHSGRYPYGSGQDPYQHDENFFKHVKRLRSEGVPDKMIAKGFGLSMRDFRSRWSQVQNDHKQHQYNQYLKMREKGMSRNAIAKRLGESESTIRGWENGTFQRRMTKVQANADILKADVLKRRYVDVGMGVEQYFNTNANSFTDSVRLLVNKDKFVLNKVKIRQMGTGKDTTTLVLSPPGTTLAEVVKNRFNIVPPSVVVSEEDPKNAIQPIERPKSVDSRRIEIRYGDQVGSDGSTGTDKDGLIELRRGVDDISLGQARYAQVRIAVDGTHYLKGMAVYSDDLPDGVDIRFNTNKKMDGHEDKLSVMKPMKTDRNGEIDWENPFGAAILDDEDTEHPLILAQRHYTDANGDKQLSCLNIVSEEGSRDRWSKNLSAQFLSKQSPALAKRQLDLQYAAAKDEFNDILSMTNPAVREKLLDEFAEKCDKNASTLKAMSFPGQASKYILPYPGIDEHKAYCTGYEDGTQLALIRYPHAGIFEIPIVTVDNNYAPAKRQLGNSVDCIGINPKAASQLSGADFDGDSVICIPITDRVKVRTAQKLLNDFDPKDAYPGYEGMKKMDSATKQQEMGKVSNLITDMTVQKAPIEDIVLAVKHSMVVIDAEKHGLNWKLSEKENEIQRLKDEYQGGGGTSTLISSANSGTRIPQRKKKPQWDMSEEEKRLYSAGYKVYEDTNATYSTLGTFKKRDMTPEERARWDNPHEEISDPKVRKAVIKDEHEAMKREAAKDGRVQWVRKGRLEEVTKMSLADDAFDLASGGSRENTTRIEQVYGDFANNMKELARDARAQSRREENSSYFTSAAKTYSAEVTSLKGKLAEAEANSPLERYAQRIANRRAAARLYSTPGLDDEHKRRIRTQEQEAARKAVGAKKKYVEITDREWDAIQAGALRKDTVSRILRNARPERVKELAMPKRNVTLSSSKLSYAKAMLRSGYTQAEVAKAIGVSTTTLVRAVGPQNLR